MISLHLYEEIVRAALREDAPFGDPFGEMFQGDASGLFLAGGDGVLCGGQVAKEVFRQVDPSVSVSFSPDGRRVAAGDRVGEASGPAGSLLRAERVALNFLQRLSGVATATSLYASRIAAHGTKLLDTRKTTPLLRVLEKYAVRVGGGANHR
ncbi:MAG: nicotinate-nucleotide diphosphorylase (carboxylating), partial [Candidatus Deferrimicrobium sp.]